MTLLILFGIVLPAAIAALIASPPLPAAPLRVAVAVVGGFVAAFYALGFQELRASEGWPWLALAAAIVGALTLPLFPRVALWLALEAFTAHQVIPPGLFEDDDWRPWRMQCYAAVAGCVVTLGVFAPSSKRYGNLIWTGIVAGGAGLLFWSGIGLFAQMALALALALAPIAPIRTRTNTDRGRRPSRLCCIRRCSPPGASTISADVPTWAFAVTAPAPVGLAATRSRRSASARRARAPLRRLRVAANRPDTILPTPPESIHVPPRRGSY